MDEVLNYGRIETGAGFGDGYLHWRPGAAFFPRNVDELFASFCMSAQALEASDDCPSASQSCRPTPIILKDALGPLVAVGALWRLDETTVSMSESGHETWKCPLIKIIWVVKTTERRCRLLQNSYLHP